MRKLFISTMALVIGLAFTTGVFAEKEGAAPAEKESTKMAPEEESHESKAVETKSASSKKKMKKEKKSKKAKKETASPAH